MPSAHVRLGRRLGRLLRKQGLRKFVQSRSYVGRVHEAKCGLRSRYRVSPRPLAPPADPLSDGTDLLTRGGARTQATAPPVGVTAFVKSHKTATAAGTAPGMAIVSPGSQR